MVVSLLGHELDLVDILLFGLFLLDVLFVDVCYDAGVYGVD